MPEDSPGISTVAPARLEGERLRLGVGDGVADPGSGEHPAGVHVYVGHQLPADPSTPVPVRRMWAARLATMWAWWNADVCSS